MAALVLILVTQKVPFRLGLVIAKATVTRPVPLRPVLSVAQIESLVSPWGVDVVNVTVLPDCMTLVSVPACSVQFGSPVAWANNA